MRLRPFSPAAILASTACVAALGLSACDSPQEDTETTTPAAPTSSAHSAKTNATSSTSTASATTTTSAPKKEPKKDCRAILLSDTALRPILGVPIVPIFPEGSPSPGLQSEAWGYLGQVADNHFDPCAELSWVTFPGAEGDLENPDADHTFATIVFFHEDELITAPMPAQVGAVVGVTRRSDSELEVTTTRRDAEGESTARVRYQDGKMQITSENPEDALVHPDSRLDLSGVTAPIAPRLYNVGSVHRHGYDQEIMSVQGASRDAVLFDVDRSLQVSCVIEEVPLCQAADPEKADWIPGTTDPVSGVAIFNQDAEYHANQVRVITTDPVQAQAVEGQLDRVSTVAEVGRGKRVLFDGYIFDTTRENELRIYASEDAESAAWISAKEYGVAGR
ncbi:LppP/LprE family lipoprotein [Corynebacterium sp. zg-331]|uniref:LppP/LprE family lipoprotein n=1 Tax=unclassified Corynebacterium TaxID=2624378 RepID=UPI00128E5751|nr:MULTISPECIES: LppP/LprE family lipoprotein [unclassified Corynebacterium]MBC3185001.1 LppP/LprE family lipoprotein [Corynebacterium sp. zg-331]MPV51503.1 hypothetical protein [Corynebacterium sp. zg331]